MIKYKIFIIKLRRTMCFLAAAAADETEFLLSCTTFNLYKLKWDERGTFDKLISSNLHSSDKLITIFISLFLFSSTYDLIDI